MIQYNPKDWFTFIFRLHKADTFRQLGLMMFCIAFYTLLIAVLEKDILHLTDASNIKNLPTMHNLVGLVLSLLLVFRTNTAYDRWWEGRKLWGSLVNNSRNLAMKLNSLLSADNKTDRDFWKTIIPAYASVLKNHLRSKKTTDELFEVDIHYNLLKDIEPSQHAPNQIASRMFEKANEMVASKKITELQLLLIKEELTGFTDICGACERISNTPIPFAYSAFLKKFIFIYIMTLPFGYVFTLGYLSVPVVAFVFYVLASLEIIAEEIENPFGEDSNDLPTDKISQNILMHVEELL